MFDGQQLVECVEGFVMAGMEFVHQVNFACFYGVDLWTVQFLDHAAVKLSSGVFLAIEV